MSEYVTTDIWHYITDNWDIRQMIVTMNHVGIDVCGADMFYIIKDDKRHQIKNCIDIAVMKDIAGISIPVLPKEILLGYKKLMGRLVDLQDVAQLEL